MVIAKQLEKLKKADKIWWFDFRDCRNANILDEAVKSTCSHVLMSIAQAQEHKSLQGVVVWCERESDLDCLDTRWMVLTPSEKIRQNAISKGFIAGLYVTVSNLEAEFPNCIAICERGDPFVVIDIAHATYIPYELLVAIARNSGTKILRSIPIKGLQDVVDDIDQSLNAFATMEHGIGVLLRTEDPKSLDSLSHEQRSREKHHVNLVEAEVYDVVHTGLGDRVCVDTTSMLKANEGMIIGSTGWGGIFVCSETHYLPHMNLREFRVNAGGVHSYIWGPGDTATYLNEAKAGAEVLAVNTEGVARSVVVGRAKIEKRPLILVKCRVRLDSLSKDIREIALSDAILKRSVTPDGEMIADVSEEFVFLNAFLQNDWHVRIMGANNVVKHSSLLVPGDKILAHVDIPGRHTGMRIVEHILEK